MNTAMDAAQNTLQNTVLIYTSPARGHLYPMMDVALALRSAGHRVILQTLADEKARVEGEGLEHRPIAPAIESLELDDYRGTSPMAQLKAAFECWLARAPHEVADLRAASADLSPDLLIVDANTWGAAAFAEAQGRPWASFLPYALPVPSPDTPAFGPGFAPPQNWLDRMRDRVVGAISGAAMRGSLRGLSHLRTELGVAPIRSYADLFLRSDLLLYRTAEPFEYARSAWPTSVKQMGPGLWAPAGQAPEWLHDLPHPRVLVSVSTEYQEDDAIIRTALEALADEPGSVIVTTAAIDPAKFQAPNERVRIEQFLPHAEVVPHVDVVVTHGGMGTTQRALAAGVPVVVVPWGRDQSESARRAEVCGAGVMVPRAKLTPERLREAVRDARTKRPAAERIAEAFAAAGGAERAVELIEELLEARGAQRQVA